MWLATKEATKGSRKRPSREPVGLAELATQLGGVPDAISYRRLAEEHPEVELGPDQDRLDHYNRLKRQRDFWRSTDTSEVDRRAADPNAQVRDEPNAKLPAWMQLRQQEQDQAAQSSGNPAAPTPGFHPGLPHRIPGWYTGDSEAHQSPPGYGVPPMSRRDPGASLRAPESRPAVPQQQSHADWVKWLGEKGIYLDLNGQRMSPQQMELPKRPLLTGPNIWHQFVDDAAPGALPPGDQIVRPKNFKGRHRASLELMAAYVDAMLLDLDGQEIGKISSWESQ